MTTSNRPAKGAAKTNMAGLSGDEQVAKRTRETMKLPVHELEENEVAPAETSPMTIPRFSNCITRANISAAEAESLSTRTTSLPS